VVSLPPQKKFTQKRRLSKKEPLLFLFPLVLGKQMGQCIFVKKKKSELKKKTHNAKKGWYGSRE